MCAARQLISTLIQQLSPISLQYGPLLQAKLLLINETLLIMVPTALHSLPESLVYHKTSAHMYVFL